jgi:hypothetical protein
VSFARVLGATNLGVLRFVPLGCVMPQSSFYTKLEIKTIGPIIPLVLLWIRPAVHTVTGAQHVEKSAQFAAKYSLLWLELTLTSVSTTIIETFV